MTPRHLYVHVPFCARRCSYCDFAIAVRRTVPVDEFLDGIRSELDQHHALSRGATLDTVYLGGGTPSRLGPEGVARLLSQIRERFTLETNAEVTLEANPDDVAAGDAAAWVAAGINRVSLGVQSFDDTVLEWMHRTHDAEEGRAAVAALREGGIRNVSVDLIFALPDHLGRSWRSDLQSALELEPDHISLYGLTVESHTPLARWEARGAVRQASEDLYADEFLLADRMATAAGFTHYEVSNFARPGKESRHNSAYWSGAQYLGVGPSAHSFDGATRSWNVAPYAEWVARLRDGRSAVEGSEHLGPESRDAERIYLGLRTTGGLATSTAELEHARRWSDAGWARIDDGTVVLTPEGWLLLDSLAAGLTGL